MAGRMNSLVSSAQAVAFTRTLMMVFNFIFWVKKTTL